MIKLLREFGTNSIIFGLGSASSKVLAFLLLPIYTRYLSPDEYGIITLLGLTATIVGIISRMGIDTAIIWAIKHEDYDAPIILSTAVLFQLLEGIAIFSVLGFISPLLSGIVLGTAVYSYLLKLSIATVLLNSVTLIFLSTLQIQEKPKLYAFFILADFLVITFFKIVFIVFLDLGVDGYIYSDLIGTALFGIIYLIYLHPYLKFRVSFVLLNKMVGFGSPLVMVGLSGVLLTSADRFFLEKYFTLREVGLYSLGYSMGLAILVLVQGVQRAWPVQFIKIAKQENAPEKLSRISTYFFLVIMFWGLLISIFAREAVIIFTTRQYYDAYIIVPLVVFSYVIYGLRSIINVGVWLENKNRYLVPITIYAVIANLILNFLLIPTFGMLGAAWATILSYGLIFLLELRINLRFYPIPYEYQRIGKIIIACLGAYFASLLANDINNLFLALSAKSICLLLYPTILFFIGFYSSQELDLVKKTLLRSSTIIRNRLTNTH